MEKERATHILWDYLCLNQTPNQADCIVGFGCYNEDVARRAAQLYRQGYAPWVLFTGGLGRNTRAIWKRSEAEHFATVAVEAGVPESAILKEECATNTGENLIFSRRLLMERGIPAKKILAVHKPYMERRLFAAFPVYWPEAEVTVTSWQQSYEAYLAGLSRWGRNEAQTIQMLAGDFQRIVRYAELGYQIPQQVPPQVWEAFDTLVALGYTDQLIQ